MAGSPHTQDPNSPEMQALLRERQRFYDTSFNWGRLSTYAVGVIVLLLLINWAM